MIHSLKVSKLIGQRLEESEELAQMLGSRKVFPVIADYETAYPLVTFQRLSVTPATSTKDGRIYDTVQFQTNIIAASYEQSVEIADTIRGLLENRYMANGEVAMVETYMSSCTESFNSNAYIQQLTFTTKVMNT